MIFDVRCKNCSHLKESNKLIVKYPGGPKVFPGTMMYDTHLESRIKGTQCTCQSYIPMNSTEQS
jgi:hypothetical protein